MNYIQCKHCGGLYCLDKVDSDFCDWCGSEFDTSEIIYSKKYEENNKKLGERRLL